MAMRKSKNQTSRRIRMSRFGRYNIECGFQNVERLAAKHPDESKYNVTTNGQLLLLAIQEIAHFESEHGKQIDWFEVSRYVAGNPEGADAVQKVPTTPVPFTIGPKIEKGIQAVKDATAADDRFHWKRSGGVYIGYAVMLILVVFNLLAEGKDDKVLASMVKRQQFFYDNEV